MNLVFCTAPAERVFSAVRYLLPDAPPGGIVFIGPSSSPIEGKEGVRFISWGEGVFSWAAAATLWRRMKDIRPSRTILPLNNPEGDGYGVLRAFSRLVTEGEVTEYAPDGTARALKESFITLCLRPEERWHEGVIACLELARPLFGYHAPDEPRPAPEGTMEYAVVRETQRHAAPPEISVVIRARNEAKLVGKTLAMVFAQKDVNAEVIVVDSQSDDATVAICREFPARIFSIPKISFSYGAALNLGARLARGNVVVNLSAHAVPAHERWLKELADPLADETIAAVHGKEAPIEGWCGAFEQKILADSFGDTPRISASGHFFSNANTAIPRGLLLKHPFDERAGWAEDQLWAHEMQSRGYAICYRPGAAVYHSHNLSMKGNFERCFKYHRAMFGSVWKGREEEVRRSFKAKLARRSVSFRKFLCRQRGMNALAAMFYAPYCEYANYLGCREAAREAALRR